MAFVLLCLLVHGALGLVVGQQLGAPQGEDVATVIHFAATALVNAALLATVRRRRLSLLTSPAAAFLVMNQAYFTISGLKYFDPNILTPQFQYTMPQRLAGSLAAQAVMLACVGVLALSGTTPSRDVVSGWLLRTWPDLRRMVLAALAGSFASKAALLALGYGSSYNEAQFSTIVVRSSADLVLFLLSETATIIVLSLGVLVAFGRRFGPVSPALRLLAAAGVLGELGYSLLFLKARLLVLTAMVFGLFAWHVLRPRTGERALGAFLFSLPVLSLLGLQLTLAIGRTNLPPETGLRLGIAFVNSRADLTDFPTAMLVRGGDDVKDPSIAAMAVLNAIPRVVFPGKEDVVRDVYSDILGRIGWPAGYGESMLADYQDSVFSAGVMFGGYAGLAIVPIAFVWLLCVLGRVAARTGGPIVSLCLLLGLSLAATHIEVEWATIVLNLRQALSYALLLLAVVVAGRAGHRVMVDALRPLPPEPLVRP